ncbi:MAG: DUF86 domain-containing protein [Oligoflexia bacterium]|nr:DUF86 domain-containing protein [Oligoflexia bacterium]
MRDYNLYIKDIINSVDSINSFIAGMDFHDFINDDKTFSAVIRKLEIIGEASKKIPAHIKKKIDNIPWKKVAGMRDVLIHDYFGVDDKLVWETIKNDLNILISELKKLNNNK